MSDGVVPGTYRLEDTDHLRTLEDDDEQTADHGEASHAHHEDEDDPDGDVEQFQP